MPGPTNTSSRSPPLALIGGQEVLVNVQDQRGQRGPVHLVGSDRRLAFSGSRRHVPTAVLVLVFEKELAHRGVPLVPVLAAGLVKSLDGIVVVIVEVRSSIRLPLGRSRLELHEVVER